jgi:hypothetical protein
MDVTLSPVDSDFVKCRLAFRKPIFTNAPSIPPPPVRSCADGRWELFFLIDALLAHHATRHTAFILYMHSYLGRGQGRGAAGGAAANKLDEMGGYSQDAYILKDAPKETRKGGGYTLTVF